MAVCIIPQDGDVVIRQQNRERAVVYVLRTAPGPDQYVLRSCEEAVAQAVRAAQRQSVRAWLTDEGCNYLLLEDFRLVESVQADA
jgi:hypothetical protein